MANESYTMKFDLMQPLGYGFIMHSGAPTILVSKSRVWSSVSSRNLTIQVNITGELTRCVLACVRRTSTSWNVPYRFFILGHSSWLAMYASPIYIYVGVVLRSTYLMRKWCKLLLTCAMESVSLLDLNPLGTEPRSRRNIDSLGLFAFNNDYVGLMLNKLYTAGQGDFFS